MFGYSDDELIENYYFNYLINYALGIRTIRERNLAERTLYEFRERVYTYALNHLDEENLIFKQFINLTEGFIAKAGISTKEQRMDSTMIMPNIKKAGRLSLAFDVLSIVVNLIPEELMTEPFTTDYKLEQNTKSDVDIAKERISELKQTTECYDLYSDGCYYSKDVIDIGIENEITVYFTDMKGLIITAHNFVKFVKHMLKVAKKL